MSIIKPTLRIFDYDKTIEFYVGWLGFKIDFTHTFEPGMPRFMQVSLRDVILYLSEHHGDGSPGVHITIEGFEGLKAYRNQLIAKKYKYNRPGLKTAFWDPAVITVTVVDPVGNRITFTERWNRSFFDDLSFIRKARLMGVIVPVFYCAGIVLQKSNEVYKKMKAYLFGWNPIKFKWEDLDEDIKKLSDTGSLQDNWSVVSHKTIQPGDKAYIVRVGVEPKGIFASGYISSAPFLALRKGRTYYRIEITLAVLLNPDKQPILTLDILKTGNLAIQNWTPQASGISIRPEIADELEGVWQDFLNP